MRPHVLQIGYDATLCTVRSLILEHEGFEVQSALGNREGELLLRTGNYDLALVGWSGSFEERRQMVLTIKRIRPDLPAVALCFAHLIASKFVKRITARR